MRREYRKILLKKIKKGDFPYLLFQSLKLPLVWLGAKVRKPLTGPIHAILIVTYRCNLRCQMCDLWRRPAQARQKELSTKEFLRVIDDLAKMKTTGIGFTGGEPLLREDIFELIAYAHQRGMVTHLATNGILLGKKNIDRLLTSGLDAVSFSLDGPNAETHDKIRAQKGTFEKVIKNIQLLDQARKGQNQGLSLLVNCALSDLNAAEVLNLVEQVPHLGVDGLGFIPVQESGLAERRKDDWQKLKIKKQKLINQIMDELIKIKKENPSLIDNTLSYLSLLKDFFQGRPLPIPCLAGYHTGVIDAYGEIFPCIPFSNLNRSWANIRQSPLRKIWQSQEYQLKRQKLASCRDCYWNCHTEVNLMFNKPRTK